VRLSLSIKLRRDRPSEFIQATYYIQVGPVSLYTQLCHVDRVPPAFDDPLKQHGEIKRRVSYSFPDALSPMMSALGHKLPLDRIENIVAEQCRSMRQRHIREF
jgi:hypothetical protein